MPDIHHQLKIHAAPANVFHALTTAEGLRNWWTRDATIDPRVGAVGEFGFYGKRFVAQVTVEALDAPRRIVWKVANGAWPGKSIEFGLTADGSDTLLAFAHRGFPEANAEYAGATTRWGYYLVSLKRYLEGRPGTPNPDDTDAFG